MKEAFNESEENYILEGSTKVEAKEYLKLALPMFFTQLASHATGVIAALMTGNYSTLHQAAVATGNMLFWPAFLGIGGTLFIVTSFVAQSFGADKKDQIGPIVKQSFWLTIPMIFLFVLYVVNTNFLLDILGTPDEVKKITSDYMIGLMLGAPALFLVQPLRSLCEGMKKPLPISYINGFMVIINALINYLLIFGKFGFPELGARGCGIAFVISSWTSLAMLLIYVKYSSYFKEINIFERLELPDWKRIFEILKLGVPIGGTLFIEIAVFSGAGLILSGLGAKAIAAHSIAMQVTTVTFMLPLSIGLAANVRVGNLVGSGNMALARFSSFYAMFFALFLAVINTYVLIEFGSSMATYFNPDKEIVAVAASLLIIAGIFQIADGLNFSGVGALRGYKDTQILFFFMLFSYWFVGMPVGYLLSMTDTIVPSMGPQGMWIGLTIGLFFSATLVIARVNYTTGIGRNKFLENSE